MRTALCCVLLGLLVSILHAKEVDSDWADLQIRLIINQHNEEFAHGSARLLGLHAVSQFPVWADVDGAIPHDIP